MWKMLYVSLPFQIFSVRARQCVAHFSRSAMSSPFTAIFDGYHRYILNRRTLSLGSSILESTVRGAGSVDFSLVDGRTHNEAALNGMCFCKWFQCEIECVQNIFSFFFSPHIFDSAFVSNSTSDDSQACVTAIDDRSSRFLSAECSERVLISDNFFPSDALRWDYWTKKPQHNIFRYSGEFLFSSFH